MLREDRLRIEDELPVDPLKPENAASENDPEGEPWDDDEAAVRTVAMSAPEIDSSIPSPISSPPPADAGETVAAGRLPPSLQALASAVMGDATEAVEPDEVDLDEAEIEEVEEADEDDSPRRPSPADAAALREKLRSVQGLSPAAGAPPRPGVGRSPSVPRAATALAAPLGFGPGRGGATSTASSPGAASAKGGAGVAPVAAASAPKNVAAARAAEDDDDAATRAASREEFLGTDNVPVAALPSNHPEEATRALPNGGFDLPNALPNASLSNPGLSNASLSNPGLSSPGLPRSAPKVDQAPMAPPPSAASGPGVFSWGRGAAVAEAPPSVDRAAPPPVSVPQPVGGFPAPPPSFPQHPSPGVSSPGDFAQRTASGSAPGVPSHPGVPSGPGVPPHLTRTGGWPTGQPNPWAQPFPMAPGATGPITGQVILFIAIGALSLAIFVIGVVLFVTTKF